MRGLFRPMANPNILLGGCPATGKSTLAKSLLGGYRPVEFDEWVQSRYGVGLAIANTLYSRDPDGFESFLKAMEQEAEHGPCVFVDTWGDSFRRAQAIERLGIGCLIYLQSDLQTLLERNEKRGQPVPQETLINCFFRQEIPEQGECLHVKVMQI